ncbi:unnamed protein product [Rhodiola kirilowii]
MELLSGSSANFIYAALATPTNPKTTSIIAPNKPPPPSRYESQKRRDWNTFNQYLSNHRPVPVPLSVCSGSNVVEFLKYLDQFGKTKVHIQTCPYFGLSNPPSPCPCSLRQAWGSLDALIGRLRAAYEEHGGKPGTNPFGARGVRVYLREVREYQAKARGISYDKKRKRNLPKEAEKPQLLPLPTLSSSAAAAAATIGVVTSFAGHHHLQ